MSQINVSVIVPVYHVKDYLDRCVQSLLRQSYKDYEIILVDDGSQDECSWMCDNYAKEYDIITAYHKENGGLSSARNYGAQYANGEWVTFVDSDDYVLESYIEDLMLLIEKYDADMAITKVVWQSEEEAISKMEEVFSDFLADKKRAFWEVYVDNHVGWSACGKMLKKNILLKYPFPDGYYEDSASAYLHIKEADRIAIGDFRNNYKYIRRSGSITASKLSNKHLRIFEVCQEIEEYINQTYPEWDFVPVLIYQNAVLQLLNRLNVSWKDYKYLFYKYRNLFRKNCVKILKQTKIRKKSKYYTILLCTTPVLYKIQNICLKLIRKQ